MLRTPVAFCGVAGFRRFATALFNPEDVWAAELRFWLVVLLATVALLPALMKFPLAPLAFQ